MVSVHILVDSWYISMGRILPETSIKIFGNQSLSWLAVLFHGSFLLGEIFDTEAGGVIFLRNVC
jgi:hypothetical protein